MPEVIITSERETPAGLAFEARIGGSAQARTIEVRLHWADYNHWSPDGADPPERVALAAVRFACSRTPAADLPTSFDASTLRRRFPEADEAIMSMVRRSP